VLLAYCSVFFLFFLNKAVQVENTHCTDSPVFNLFYTKNCLTALFVWAQIKLMGMYVKQFWLGINCTLSGRLLGSCWF